MLLTVGLFMTFGTFIEPYTNPADIDALIIANRRYIGSGFQAVHAAHALRGQNRIFDRVVDAVASVDMPYEDQCSTRYYFDLVQTLRDLNGQFDRVVEVGVFLGGSTAYLAACSGPFDYDLDLVDIRPPFLRFAYERVRRANPEAAQRIRLFQGDLPTYVEKVLSVERGRRSIVHHDGAHEFQQVVRDMASLSFVQDDLVAVIAQDTHLRGSVGCMNFVDMALYAVFGLDMRYASIGYVAQEGEAMTRPDAFFGNYFLAGAPEGFVIPMALNRFVYPHRQHALGDFLPTPETVAQVMRMPGADARADLRDTTATEGAAAASGAFWAERKEMVPS